MELNFIFKKCDRKQYIIGGIELVIGIISDTHRHKFIIAEAVKKMGDVDMIVHLGDNVDDVGEIEKLFKGKIINVKGNCDYSNSVPSERIEIIENKKIFMTHGHKYNVKYDLNRLRYRAMELEVDIALFGHSHVSEIVYEQGVWFINPGSAALARDGKNTIAIIKLEKNNISPEIRLV